MPHSRGVCCTRSRRNARLSAPAVTSNRLRARSVRWTASPGHRGLRGSKGQVHRYDRRHQLHRPQRRGPRHLQQQLHRSTRDLRMTRSHGGILGTEQGAQIVSHSPTRCSTNLRRGHCLGGTIRAALPDCRLIFRNSSTQPVTFGGFAAGLPAFREAVSTPHPSRRAFSIYFIDAATSPSTTTAFASRSSPPGHTTRCRRHRPLRRHRTKCRPGRPQRHRLPLFGLQQQKN